MQTKIEKLHIFKCEIAEKYYNSECFICKNKITFKFRDGKPRLYGYSRGFTFHHVWYVENDVRHGDYKDPSEYNQDLSAEIEKNPDRFILLCKKDHNTISRLISMSPEKRSRVLEAVQRSVEAPQ